MSSPTDGTGRFALRASLLFAGLVMLNIVAGVLLLSSDRPIAERALAALGPTAWGVLAVVLIFGLASRTWAIGASIVVLWGLIFVGAIDTLVALGQGRLNFPIGLFLAAVVLRSLPPGTRVWSGDGAARGAVAGALVVVIFVSAWPLALAEILRPGASPLSLGEDALQVALEVDCAPPSAVGEPVDAIASVEWQWRTSEWFLDGTDKLTVEWYSVTTSSEPAYFILDGYAARDAGAGPQEADRGPGSVSFEIDARSDGPLDGALTLDLRGDSRRQGDLVVRVRYSHLDRWTTRSEWITCSW